MKTINVSSARDGEDQYTINYASQFPENVVSHLKRMPQGTNVTVHARLPRSQKSWPWAYSINRKGKNNSLTTRFWSKTLPLPELGENGKVSVNVSSIQIGNSTYRL